MKLFSLVLINFFSYPIFLIIITYLTFIYQSFFLRFIASFNFCTSKKKGIDYRLNKLILSNLKQIKLDFRLDILLPKCLKTHTQAKTLMNAFILQVHPDKVQAPHLTLEQRNAGIEILYSLLKLLNGRVKDLNAFSKDFKGVGLSDYRSDLFSEQSRFDGFPFPFSTDSGFPSDPDFPSFNKNKMKFSKFQNRSYNNFQEMVNEMRSNLGKHTRVRSFKGSINFVGMIEVLNGEIPTPTAPINLSLFINSSVIITRKLTLEQLINFLDTSKLHFSGYNISTDYNIKSTDINNIAVELSIAPLYNEKLIIKLLDEALLAST